MANPVPLWDELLVSSMQSSPPPEPPPSVSNHQQNSHLRRPPITPDEDMLSTLTSSIPYNGDQRLASPLSPQQLQQTSQHPTNYEEPAKSDDSEQASDEECSGGSSSEIESKSEHDHEASSHQFNTQHLHQLSHKLIKEHKLQAKSVQHLTLFAKVSVKSGSKELTEALLQLPDSHERDLALLAAILEVTEILDTGEKTQISTEGEKQIKKYAHGALLTHELPAYRQATTIKVVLVCLLIGWTKNPKKDLINKEILEQLNEGCFALKKKLNYSWLSIIEPARNHPKMDIAELAKSLVGASFTVTAAHWARYAFLCRILTLDPSKDYWKTVDKMLLDVRTSAPEKAGDNPRKMKSKVDQYFHGVLEDDFKIFEDPADRKIMAADMESMNEAVPGSTLLEEQGTELSKKKKKRASNCTADGPKGKCHKQNNT
ncbi:hypothetical protein M422DRAFT_47202 [Sphaerobolus stellatus SS14]|uniref:Uncharacterized protein n=1 Tax=Sphaerobolus stellatus (strain SS14) TaxID=990650 RepID=A0A0C9UPM1_SPHS4|nr:hypothetical protein M422DRAFT_47202 [Sphaerobolus stellatus SS14]